MNAPYLRERYGEGTATSWSDDTLLELIVRNMSHREVERLIKKLDAIAAEEASA